MDEAGDLDAAIIAAHQRNDWVRLISLYTAAAERSDNLDEACFFLTNAYILALEQGAPEKENLAARLRAHGRL